MFKLCRAWNDSGKKGFTQLHTAQGLHSTFYSRPEHCIQGDIFSSKAATMSSALKPVARQ